MRVKKSFKLQNHLRLCYVPILCTTFALLLVDNQLNVLADKSTTKNPARDNTAIFLPLKEQQQVVFSSTESYEPRNTHPLAAITPFGSNFNLVDLFSLFSSKKVVVQDTAKQTSSLDLDNQLFKESPTSDSEINTIKEADNHHHHQKHKQELRDSFVEKSPVILVPGYGGSRLEAKLDKPKRVHYFCDLKSDWTDAWVNVKLLLPYMIDCLIDNLRLEYNYSTNTTKNTEGVEVRVKNSEHISSVEYLNDIQINGFAYFAPIIEKLVTTFNYSRELDLIGAPYDFRKAPNEMGEYFDRLKVRIEQLYESNGRQSITFICHSMGCNNLLYLFQRQTKEWKKLYVRRLVSIAAPWGGCLMALKAAAMGHNLGMPYLFSESQLIKVQRSLPSTIYLFPHPKVFGDVPLIRTNVELSTYNTTVFNRQASSINLTPHKLAIRQSSREARTYVAHELTQFFEDIDHPDGYRMWLDTKDLLGSLDAPGVELWCLVGRGQKTLGRMEYFGEFPISPSVDLYDDGDGTVTLQSASYCTRWQSEQREPVYYQEFPVAHAEMLKEAQVLKYLEKIMNSQ